MLRFLGLLAAFLLTAAPSFASPLPYYNQPLDTPNSAANAVVASVNTSMPAAQTLVACTGTTTSTCQGTRINVSITGLTTADAGAVSAAMTVTDASVTAASQIICNVIGYAGTGVPYDAIITPAAGSFSFVIQNNSASAALNATVISACLVFN